MAFGLADLELLGAKAAEDFKESLCRNAEGSQAELSRTVEPLIGKLEFAYGVSARLAHRETTLEEGRCAIPPDSNQTTSNSP